MKRENCMSCGKAATHWLTYDLMSRTYHLCDSCGERSNVKEAIETYGMSVNQYIKYPPFIVEDSYGEPVEHEMAHSDCMYCWEGYPERCGCGGLIHAEFLDDLEDGIYLTRKCDGVCGE